MARAQELFEHSMRLDPQFALAHAEFGHLFFHFVTYGVMPPREALPLMRREARLALAIDASLPEGHAMLGTVAAMFDYDWQEAERHFRLAMASSAVSSLVHRYYAQYCLLPTGRAQEAVHQHTLGLGDDPMNLSARAERAVCLRAASRNEEANDELRAIVQIDEAFWFPYFILGVNLALDERLDEASIVAEQAYRRAPWFKPIVGLQAAMLRRAGETDRAEKLMDELWPKDGYSDPIGPAIFHLVCGDLEAAAEWTEKAIDQRQPAVLFFLNGHAKALRSTARWPTLARMMNLPEA
jgi:tetratricopeptide (TPR) repeat protein